VDGSSESREYEDYIEMDLTSYSVSFSKDSKAGIASYFIRSLSRYLIIVGNISGTAYRTLQLFSYFPAN